MPISSYTTFITYRVTKIDPRSSSPFWRTNSANPQKSFGGRKVVGASYSHTDILKIDALCVPLVLEDNKVLTWQPDHSLEARDLGPRLQPRTAASLPLLLPAQQEDVPLQLLHAHTAHSSRTPTKPGKRMTMMPRRRSSRMTTMRTSSDFPV